MQNWAMISCELFRLRKHHKQVGSRPEASDYNFKNGLSLRDLPVRSSGSFAVKVPRWLQRLHSKNPPPHRTPQGQQILASNPAQESRFVPAPAQESCFVPHTETNDDENNSCELYVCSFKGCEDPKISRKKEDFLEESRMMMYLWPREIGELKHSSSWLFLPFESKSFVVSLRFP